VYTVTLKMATTEANLVILAVWSLLMNFKTFAASVHLGLEEEKKKELP
jgi:hypothetical protein